MPTRPIAELIADMFVGHSVNLLRLDAGEQRTIVKMLGQLQREVERVIMASDVDDRTIFQERRLTALWKSVNELTDKYYNKIAVTHRDRLAEIAEVVGDQTKSLTNAIIGVPLLSVGAPIEVLRALADDSIVQGRPAREWWMQQRNNLRGRFQNTMRQGIFAGDNLGTLLRRVRGTRERNFKDGIFSMSTREASALIRTSVMSVANAARHETLQANDDVLAGQQVFATLDGRVCPTCLARDGFAWDFQGLPLNAQTTENFPGPPPWHFNDRCVLSPVLKSWEQLARHAKGDEKLAKKLDRVEARLPKGKKAAMGGEVGSAMSYADWLARRTQDEQQEILGLGKWKLWKDGKISLTDLVDTTGRPLTLKELRASVA